MNRAYLIHYAGRHGLCCAVEYGADVFAAIARFLELRQLGQIVAVRRLTNGHNNGPVLL